MSKAAALNASLRMPLIAAPLFLVSNPKLVIAQCAAGVVGSFPALNARKADRSSDLEAWLCEIEEGLKGTKVPFAVNQIVHKSNARLMSDMEIIVQHKVPIVITSLGANVEVNEAVHSYGGIVLHDVINGKYARKAVEKGADGLIAVAHGAGGHAGAINPLALVEEIREWFDGPLALSGAMGTGRAVAAAIAAGADFGYVGSAFIATHEANASDEYKAAIVDCGAEDIVNSNLFTGVHGNYLRRSVELAGMDPDNLPSSDPSKMDLNETAKAWKDIWGCGQGIGPVKKIMGTREVVDRFHAEFRAAQERLATF